MESESGTEIADSGFMLRKKLESESGTEIPDSDCHPCLKFFQVQNISIHMIEITYCLQFCLISLFNFSNNNSYYLRNSISAQLLNSFIIQ